MKRFLLFLLIPSFSLSSPEVENELRLAMQAYKVPVVGYAFDWTALLIKSLLS
jgi:hypothetical protein